MPACEMPLVANILTRSGSGKENLMLIFISMTFCRTILFRRKEGGPRLRGVDSGLLTAVGGFRGWNPLGEGEAALRQAQGPCR